MARIRVIHDPVGETLTVYWREPAEDQLCEEVGDGVILIKDGASQEVIGFERLYFHAGTDPSTLVVELATPVP